MSKFKVGQVWRDGRGEEVVIASLNSGIDGYPIQDSDGFTYTEDGVFMKLGWTDYDLVEIFRDVGGSGLESPDVADSAIKATHDEL